MRPTTLKELEWIHDCLLLNALYDASSESGRSITLTMRCPTDLGYAPWAGRSLVLAAIDIAVSQHIVFGLAGTETIDAIRPGVSTGLQESTREARRAGVRFPDVEFTISFHSGATLEVICRDLQVEIAP